MLEVKDGSMNYKGLVKVRFDGLSGEIALITVDLSNKYVMINTRTTQPHSYYGDKIYASVKVLNSRGEQIYLQDYIGINNYLDNEVALSIEEGYKIVFKHLEPTREYLTDENGKEESQLSEDKEFIIKESEVKPVNELVFLGHNDWEFAKVTMDPVKEKINVQIHPGKPNSLFGHSTYAFIVIYDHTRKEVYKNMIKGDVDYSEEYKEFDFKDGDVLLTFHMEGENKLFLHDIHGHTFGTASIGNAFIKSGIELLVHDSSVHLYGMKNYQFAQLIFDTYRDEIRIQIEEGQPYSVLGDKQYAKISIADENNNTIYCEIFNGNTTYDLREDIVEFKENYILTIEHLDAGNLKIYDFGYQLISKNYNKFVRKASHLVETP